MKHIVNYKKALFIVFCIALFLFNQYLFSFNPHRVVFALSGIVYFALGYVIQKHSKKQYSSLFYFTMTTCHIFALFITDFLIHSRIIIDIAILFGAFFLGETTANKAPQKTPQYLIACSWLTGLILMYFVLIPSYNFHQRLDEISDVNIPQWLYEDQNRMEYIVKEGQILILDFWFTNCGYCFKGFPELQNLYDHYESDPEVTVVAVHDGTGGMTEAMKGINRIRSLGYTFPVLVDSTRWFTNKNIITGSPTQLLANKNGSIRYSLMGYQSDSQIWKPKWIKAKVEEWKKQR